MRLTFFVFMPRHFGTCDVTRHNDVTARQAHSPPCEYMQHSDVETALRSGMGMGCGTSVGLWSSDGGDVQGHKKRPPPHGVTGVGLGPTAGAVYLWKDQLGDRGEPCRPHRPSLCCGVLALCDVVNGYPMPAVDLLDGGV